MPEREPEAMSAMLRLAVISGRVETVEMHLARLAHPDVIDRDGRTPLMLAAALGREEICALLVRKGACPDKADRRGRTARDHAIGAGHLSCLELLESGTAEGVSEQLSEEGPDGWLAEDDEVLSQGDDGAARAAALTQVALSHHEAASLDSDWSDVVIAVPTPAPDPRRAAARTRVAVRFRRSRNGDTVSGGLPADLGGDADQVLASLSLQQIVLGSDASDDLRRIARRHPECRQSGLDFLCDDDAETRLVEGGFSIADYFELTDIVNAFTVLAHRLRPVTGGSSGGGGPHEGSKPATPTIAAPTDPQQHLHAVTLAQIVLNGATSPGLRRSLARSRFGGMSADAFLLEDEPERLFEGALTAKELLELTDLVNAYTSLLFREARG